MSISLNCYISKFLNLTSKFLFNCKHCRISHLHQQKIPAKPTKTCIRSRPLIISEISHVIQIPLLNHTCRKQITYFTRLLRIIFHVCNVRKNIDKDIKIKN